MLEIVFMVGSFNLRSDLELTLLDTSSLIVFDGTQGKRQTQKADLMT